MVRLLIVDDSAYVRLAITRMVKIDESIVVVGVARDGVEAVEKAALLKPDVITMDVEMPRMTGLEALKIIMQKTPTPIIMVSSLTASGAIETMEALESGAIDYFLKSTPANPMGATDSSQDLVTKIKVAASAGRKRLPSSSLKESLPAKVRQKPAHALGVAGQVVIIASSTGGPNALYQVIPHIPADIPAAVLIVQHMPAGFTRTLADRLNEISRIPVEEAQESSLILESKALVAPGGFHMIAKSNSRVGLNKSEAVLGLRPAADVTMKSLVRHFGHNIVAAVLTGMGSDGTNGSKAIKLCGGTVIAQEESTCIVYGMPRSVVEAGLADHVAGLDGIAKKISQLCLERQKKGKNE